MAKETRTVHVKVTSNVSSVGKETSKATAQATGLKGALGGVGKAAALASGGIRTMTMALLTSGVGAIVVAFGAFVSLMGAAMRESMEFSKSLSGLQAVLGADKDAMVDFSKEAKRLGATTAFTASQVVELQTEFAKLGFTNDEILNVTESTLNLAAAAGTDLANAAMVAGSTLRGFGLSSEETARVTDVMASSFSSSALDITLFQESMKLVAPIAKTVKVDIEQASAALSVLADSGIKGSMAGTQLRRVMTDLAMKTGKDFQTSLEMTKDRLSAASSDAQKLAIAKELVGQRAASSLLILAENGEKLKTLEEAYNGASGAAERMAAIRLDNLSGDITILKSAWSGLLLSFEDGEGGLNKLARVGVQSLTKSLNAASEAANFLGFTMDYYFGKDKTEFESNMTDRTAMIGLVVSRIKKMAAEIKLTLASVPLFGRMFDKEQLQKDLDRATAMVAFASMKIKQNQEETAKKGGFWVEWEERKKRMEFKKTQALKSASSDEFIEGQGEKVDKEIDQEAAKREKFRNTLKKSEEDFEDQTEAEKIERKMNRHIAEMEMLGFTETEMRELEQQIRDHYAGIQKEKADETEAEKMERLERERLARVRMMMSNLDNAARIAGEETKLGKALLVAKQLLMAKELFMSAKNAIMEAKIKAAKSTGSVTQGFAKATATLNPAVIAGYAVSAAGIISSIASAFKASKEASSAAGVSGGGAAPTVTAQAPSFNVVGQQSAGEQAIGSRLDALAGGALKAYVVEGEVTSAQQLSNQVEETASLG